MFQVIPLDNDAHPVHADWTQHWAKLNQAREIAAEYPHGALIRHSQSGWTITVEPKA